MDKWIIDHVLTWSEALLGIIGLVTAMLYGAKKVYNIARNVERVLESVESSAKRLDSIEYQMRPNGGNTDSLRDAVHRIEERVSSLEARCHLSACGEPTK